MLRLMMKLAWFRALGLAAIVLVGPVLGIVGALLPFALIGLLVWGAYQGVLRLVGRRPATPRFIDSPREVRPVVHAEPSRELPRRRRWARAGRVLLEMTCGALLGGLVAGAICWESAHVAETIATATLVGAVVGYVVGGSPGRQSEGARPSCSAG